MKKVFLGGTCNGSKWRNYFIKDLRIDYFSPDADNWSPEMVEEEIHQRTSCDFCLYVITPKMTGVYAIAEVVDDSNKRPSKTIFAYVPLDEGNVFTVHQLKSLEQTGRMVKENGAQFFTTLNQVTDYLNTH
jgi:hypothetical protein